MAGRAGCFYGLIDGASSGLAGGIGQEAGGRTRVAVYVQAPHLQAALDRAVALGGRVPMPPMDVPGGPSMAQLIDPDGNVVGLMKGQA